MPDAQAQLQQALALHQAGDLAQAQALYDAILKAHPGHYDALHLSGVIAFQTKNFQKAIELLDKAIRINPGSAKAYTDRGNAYIELHAWDKALSSYNQAIALKPDNAAAYYNRGVILHTLGQRDAALASYKQAIALKPDYAEAHFNSGGILQELKAWDAALACYDTTIALKPEFADAYSNRGNVLKELKRWEPAIRDCDRAIALKPDHADAWYNLGNILLELRQWDAARAGYDQAITSQPNHIMAHCNRGNAYARLHQPEKALADFNKTIALNPDFAEGYSNRGNVLIGTGQLPAALASYERAIALSPGYAEAHYNKAHALLLRGDLMQGWEEYEWRWKKESFTSVKRNFPEPLWLGKESLRGKTILLHAEQGLGDTIQFCRYVPMIAALGATVILEVQNPLLHFLAGLKGVSQLIAQGDPLPAFDYHCPLLSLPLTFQTTLNTIPAQEKYLGSTSAKVERWQSKLGIQTKPCVGLAWRGSTSHSNDYNRSIALPDLVQHLPEGFQYVSLQKETTEADRQILHAHPDILHFGDELRDFSDTAALCELMDLVITVDTSVAHLGAALGRPTWILLPFTPDWRWMLDRVDSPWYPTVKLYRQKKAGDWNKPFESVKVDLLQKSTKLA